MLSLKKWLIKLIVLIISLPIILILVLSYNYIVYPHEMAVMQSYTDDTRANFVVVSKNEKIQCQALKLNSLDSLKITSNSEAFKFEDSTYIAHHCNFDNLSPASSYRLIISTTDNITLDDREFKTLDPSKSDFKIGLISCLNDLFHIPIIWDNLKSHDPDYIFMIGDNIYADLFKSYLNIDKKHIWHRYTHSWLVYKLFQQKKLTPVLALWDDHDFGGDNSDSSYPNKDFSKKLFRIFYNQTPKTPYLNQGPGVSFSFFWKKNHFIFLDNRFFRGHNEDKKGSYFSKEQILWFNKEIDLNKNDFFWIISGNQWFSSPLQDESFENNHPETLMSFFKEIQIQKFKTILISGDAHLSEVKKINIPNEKTLYEITSSGIHAFPMSEMGEDKRRLAGTNIPNFTIINFNLNQNVKIKTSNFTVFNLKNFEVEVELL